MVNKCLLNFDYIVAVKLTWSNEFDWSYLQSENPKSSVTFFKANLSELTGWLHETIAQLNTIINENFHNISIGCKPRYYYASIIPCVWCLLYVLPVSYPSCLHTTRVSALSHWSLHTVPHSPSLHTSTLPSVSVAPSFSLTSPCIHTIKEIHNNYQSRPKTMG